MEALLADRSDYDSCLDLMRVSRVSEFLLTGEQPEMSADQLLSDSANVVFFTKLGKADSSGELEESSSFQAGCVFSFDHMEGSIAYVSALFWNAANGWTRGKVAMWYDPKRRKFAAIVSEKLPDDSIRIKACCLSSETAYFVHNEVAFRTSPMTDFVEDAMFSTSMYDCSLCVARRASCTCSVSNRMSKNDMAERQALFSSSSWTDMRRLLFFMQGPVWLYAEQAGQSIRIFNHVRSRMDPTALQHILGQFMTRGLSLENHRATARSWNAKGSKNLQNPSKRSRVISKKPAVDTNSTKELSVARTEVNMSQITTDIGSHSGSESDQRTLSDGKESPGGAKRGVKRATQTEMKHECLRCGKRFPYPSKLKRHEDAAHGAKKYACAACGKRFTQKEHLTTHERHVHEDAVRLQCHVCGANFAWRACLNRHLSTRHKLKKEDAASPQPV